MRLWGSLLGCLDDFLFFMVFLLFGVIIGYLLHSCLRGRGLIIDFNLNLIIKNNEQLNKDSLTHHCCKEICRQVRQSLKFTRLAITRYLDSLRNPCNISYSIRPKIYGMVLTRSNSCKIFCTVP